MKRKDSVEEIGIPSAPNICPIKSQIVDEILIRMEIDEKIKKSKDKKEKKK